MNIWSPRYFALRQQCSQIVNQAIWTREHYFFSKTQFFQQNLLFSAKLTFPTKFAFSNKTLFFQQKSILPTKLTFSNKANCFQRNTLFTRTCCLIGPFFLAPYIICVAQFSLSQTFLGPYSGLFCLA